MNPIQELIFYELGNNRLTPEQVNKLLNNGFLDKTIFGNREWKKYFGMNPSSLQEKYREKSKNKNTSNKSKKQASKIRDNHIKLFQLLNTELELLLPEWESNFSILYKLYPTLLKEKAPSLQKLAKELIVILSTKTIVEIFSDLKPKLDHKEISLVEIEHFIAFQKYKKKLSKTKYKLILSEYYTPQYSLIMKKLFFPINRYTSIQFLNNIVHLQLILEDFLNMLDKFRSLNKSLPHSAARGNILKFDEKDNLVSIYFEKDTKYGGLDIYAGEELEIVRKIYCLKFGKKRKFFDGKLRFKKPDLLYFNQSFELCKAKLFYNNIIDGVEYPAGSTISFNKDKVKRVDLGANWNYHGYDFYSGETIHLNPDGSIYRFYTRVSRSFGRYKYPDKCKFVMKKEKIVYSAFSAKDIFYYMGLPFKYNTNIMFDKYKNVINYLECLIPLKLIKIIDETYYKKNVFFIKKSDKLLKRFLYINIYEGLKNISYKYLEFSKNGNLTSGCLGRDSTVNNSFIPKNSIISFYEDGSISKIIPSTNITVYDIHIVKNGELLFFPNGRINYCTLAGENTINNIIWKNYDRIFFFENGQIKEAEAKSVLINGYYFGYYSPDYRNKIEFYENGSLKKGTLAAYMQVSKFNLSPGDDISFYKNGKISEIKLKRITEISGIYFKRYSSVYFYASENIKSGTLRKNTLIQKTVFKAGTLIEFYNNGKIKKGTLANTTKVYGELFHSGDTLVFYKSGRVKKVN